MKAVILAAGEGTRMAPLTHSKPKVMIEVGNRPILEHLLKALTDNGVRDIIMVVGFKRERIMNHFGDGRRFQSNITYAVQEHQLGTCDAFLTSLPSLGDLDEPVLVVPGDNLVGMEGIKAIVECDKDNVLLTTSSRSSTKYGVIRARGDNVLGIEDRVVRKGELLPISTGIMKLSPHALGSIAGWLEPHTYSDLYEMTDLTDLINRYMGSCSAKDSRTRESEGAELPTDPGVCADHIFSMVSTAAWFDVVEPWDLLYMNDFVIRSTGTSIGGRMDSDVTVKGPVKIGEETCLRSGCRIYGPVVIGKGCDIGPGVVIRSSTTIGDNVAIAPNSHVKNSIIYDGAEIKMGCDIVNSVISEGVVAGSHFVSSTFKGDSTESHGTIIGEDSIIHPNVVVGAELKIGTGCIIKAGTRIEQDLPNGALVLG